jgi:hypothetical protein
MNQDGTNNVLDLVQLANIILSNGLAREEATPTEAVLKYGHGKLALSSDGLLGGMQLHTIGEYTIIDNNMSEGWQLLTGDNIILIYSTDGSDLPETALFTYEGDLLILESIVAAWNGVAVMAENRLIPADYSLGNAYPNPFNPVTNITFALPEDGRVSLSIYNLQGRLVEELISGTMHAGYHRIVWNANQYSSGMYFIKMQSGEFISNQKLMLVK